MFQKKFWNAKQLIFVNPFNFKKRMYEKFLKTLHNSNDHESKNGCFVKSVNYANVTTCKEIALSAFKNDGKIMIYLPTRNFDRIVEYFKNISRNIPIKWVVKHHSDTDYFIEFTIENDPRLDVIYDFVCFLIKFTFGKFSGFYTLNPTGLPLDYFYTYTKDYRSIFYYMWLLGNCDNKLRENNWVYDNGIDLKRISLATGLFSYLQMNFKAGMIKEGFGKTFARVAVAHVENVNKDVPLPSLMLSIMSLMSKYTNFYTLFGNWFHHNCPIDFVNYYHHEYRTLDNVCVSFINPN